MAVYWEAGSAPEGFQTKGSVSDRLQARTLSHPRQSVLNNLTDQGIRNTKDSPARFTADQGLEAGGGK